MLHPIRAAALAAGCLVMPLVLGGCVSDLTVTGSGPGGPLAGAATLSVQPTVVDAAIARYSPKLAKSCKLLEAATFLGAGFSAGKAKAAFDAGSTVLDVFCTSPPTDVPSALAAVGTAYSRVLARKAR